jgi:hypothetical protein
VSAQLAESARERSRRCEQAVLTAVKVLEGAQRPVSIKAVAAEANVSRNYIYSSATALQAVRVAMGRQQSSHPTLLKRPTAATGSSDDSLRTRLAAALFEIDELRGKLTELEARNRALTEAVVDLQNPLPTNVTDIRRRRG